MLDFLIILKVWPVFRVTCILHTNLQIDKKAKSVNVFPICEGARAFYGF